MKRTLHIIKTAILLSLLGCNLPAGQVTNPSSDNDPKPVENGPSSSTSDSSNGSDSSSDTNNDDGNDDSNGSSSNNSSSNSGNSYETLDVPSGNKSAPSGILDQIGWGGRGGGPEGPESECDNCSISMHGKILEFNDFSRYQNIDLPIYRLSSGGCGEGDALHVVTFSLQMDEHGDRTIHLSGSTDDLLLDAAYDADSGEPIWIAEIEDYLDCESYRATQSSCSGAPPQRLKINESAYVCTETDSVKLREGPGKDYSVIKSLVPGAELKVLDGPNCADSWSWWYVETESGFLGWMSEGGDSIDYYYLCPAP